MDYLAYAVIFILGLVIGIGAGIFIGTERMRKAIEEGSVGDLRIDRSEPDEPPRPCLEIYKGHTIESISQRKFVFLKILNENYLSRD